MSNFAGDYEDFEDVAEDLGNRIEDAELPDEEEEDVGPVGNRITGARARSVVEHVVTNLVEFPDEVDIDVEEHRNEVVISIHANRDDMGRLIGRRGRVINAIRTVARAAAASEGARATVDVVE